MSNPLVTPGSRIRLADYDPKDSDGLHKDAIGQHMEADQKRLGELQELLYAAGDQALLIILQGIDTSGKDGTTNHVFSAVNVTGCHVVGFKQPSQEELAHDYLWRIHHQMPRKGELVIFNRSHYESVLVERVRNLVTKQRWQKRYEQINDFEQMLTAEGTIILKFFLHISKQAQEERLRERMANPNKQWKVALSDWKERELWDDYQAAFEDMINRTSTEHAPWHIIPADKKWYRNYLVAHLLTERLNQHADAWQAALHALGGRNMAALKEAGFV